METPIDLFSAPKRQKMSTIGQVLVQATIDSIKMPNIVRDKDLPVPVAVVEKLDYILNKVKQADLSKAKDLIDYKDCCSGTKTNCVWR